MQRQTAGKPAPVFRWMYVDPSRFTEKAVPVTTHAHTRVQPPPPRSQAINSHSRQVNTTENYDNDNDNNKGIGAVTCEQTVTAQSARGAHSAHELVAKVNNSSKPPQQSAAAQSKPNSSATTVSTDNCDNNMDTDAEEEGSQYVEYFVRCNGTVLKSKRESRISVTPSDGQSIKDDSLSGSTSTLSSKSSSRHQSRRKDVSQPCAPSVRGA